MVKYSVAWLVRKSTVKSPTESKMRVTVIDTEVVTGYDGLPFTQYTFKYKGKVYVCNSRGDVYVVGDWKMRPVMTSMRVEKSAKQLHEEYVEGCCRLACDPTSETYRSM